MDGGIERDDMAKNNKGKYIAGILAVLVIGAGIVKGWTELKQAPAAVKQLKVDGCDPSQLNNERIIRMEECMRHIQSAQTEIKEEQKEMRKEQRSGFQRLEDLIKNGG